MVATRPKAYCAIVEFKASPASSPAGMEKNHELLKRQHIICILTSGRSIGTPFAILFQHEYSVELEPHRLTRHHQAAYCGSTEICALETVQMRCALGYGLLLSVGETHYAGSTDQGVIISGAGLQTVNGDHGFI